MAEVPLLKETMAATSTAPSVWVEERPPKRPNFYKDLREEYISFISGHEFLPVPNVMEALTKGTISLWTADVEPHKFIALNRETMEEALKVYSN